MSRPTITTRVLEVTETGRLVELLYDDGSNDEVLVCAAHGGRVEPGTGEQALEIAIRAPDTSCWACLGYDEASEEFDLWHPPSTAVSTAEHPLLAEIGDRGFGTVISLHGLDDDAVLVGGGIAPDRKQRLRDRLAEAVSPPVEVVSEGPHAGTSPRNFVNWLADDGTGGLQLEQSRSVREDERERVVEALETAIAEGEL